MITLKTLSAASAQEVFDQVATHLLTQKAQALGDQIVDGPNACVYKAPGGLKCAAGCLIGDDEYSPDMEGNSWAVLVDQGVSSTHQHLIDELQHIHDCVPNPEDWPTALSELAIDRGMDPSVVTGFKSCD
jgi:hypothetical protein